MIDFSGYTREAIQKEMLDQVDPNIDTREGSMIQTAIGPVAWYLEGVYMILKQIQDNAYPATAVGDCLDKIVQTRGLTRKQATAAVRKGTFNGSVIANFSPMESNEANFCKGYNYDNGRFIFNFRGAVSKISDYVFSDGHQEIIAKLSELALKSETLIYRGDFAGNLNSLLS